MYNITFYSQRIILCVFIAVLSMTSSSIKAHPHSLVSVLTEIEGDNKQLTGLTMFWTFDLMTTSDALTGTNINAENQVKILQALASEMLTNIKKSHYFTHFKIHEKALEFKTPQQATLTLEDYKLTLNFFLELEKPLQLPIKDLSLQIYEDSYFVDLLWLQQDDVQLSEHFMGDCQLNIVSPAKNNGQDSSEFLFLPATMTSPATDALASYDPLFIEDKKLGETFTQRLIIDCL